MKRKSLGVLLALFLVLGLSAGAAAQGFYVGGYSDQGQWMMNDGLIVGETIWQYQDQMQQTVLGIENMPIAEVDSYMSGYMTQQIENHCSAVYTETGNNANYGLFISTSDVSAGASAGSYSFSATIGDAYGSASSYTNVTITILP